MSIKLIPRTTHISRNNIKKENKISKKVSGDAVN